MTAESAEKTRLETWKEVAAFFRKDERTVKRWEAERGLPIHRLPGGARSRIFAVVSELEAWRDGADLDAAPNEAAPVAQPTRVLPSWSWPRSLLALGAVLAVAAVVFAVLNTNRILARMRPPPLEAQRAFVAASDDWALRTPESLDRAVSEYNAAIARDPDYAEAYAGLASTYDILREYTHMPPAQAYPLARAAARRALALDDHLASAHAALAFAEYWGFWNEAVARREFQRAIALDPRSATAQHWYATFLAAVGDERGALAHINAAQALDPTSSAVATDRGLIQILAGDPGGGVATLQAQEQAHPDSTSAHLYLAEYDLNRGAYADYLAETRTTDELTNDDEDLKTVYLAQQSLASGGPTSFLRTLTERQAARFRDGQVSAYSVACLYALSGDQARALAYLRISLDRRETGLMAARGDAALVSLRTRPAFASIITSATPLDAG
jgi:Tfp pilus assembly protein PilF